MSKSLQQFREWAEAKKTVANPQVNTYPGQCVSLIQQYIWQVFGVPYKPRGNAKDYVPPGFKRISVHSRLQPGDVVRYGRNYGGGYGHVGMIDDRGRWFDQNGVKRRAVGSRSIPFSSIEAIFRPTKKFNVKTPKPAAKKSNTTIAKEVIAGKWGNGADRKKRLARAGYNYNAVQAIVNKLI